MIGVNRMIKINDSLRQMRPVAGTAAPEPVARPIYAAYGGIQNTVANFTQVAL